MVFFPYSALMELNPSKIAVVVGYGAQTVKEALKNYPRVEFFYQENPKGGTADAVSKTVPLLENYREDFVVILNGDGPLIRAETLREGLKKVLSQGLDGLIFTTRLENPYGYGRIVRDESGKVRAIAEEKDASEEEKKIKEVNGGIYIFRIGPLLEALKEIKPSPITGELYLTDAVSIFHRKGLKIDTFETDREELLGVNDRVQLAEAERILLRRKIKSLQRAGVTVRLPETVYVEWDVSVGEDSEIEPHCVLKGNTSIGKNCLIGAGSVLENVSVGDNTKILPYSFLSDTTLEGENIVGPFARTRGGTTLGVGAEVGNFVEVKKSSIGAGTKAKHLSYVGDATIGKNCNVGAGTVFANYDGIKKHQTTVGDNSFIGSNSLIIAPRKLGEWSFVAGGSVVNRDVPPKSLAIARAKLKILEGKNPLLKEKKEGD